MARLIAMCGLDCAACSAYKATQADDDSLRARTAAEWTEMFKHEFKRGDINCDGCTSEGRHVGYCGMCEVRTCGLQHSVKTCADCTDYACDRLQQHFKMMPPDARKNLEALRVGRH